MKEFLISFLVFGTVIVAMAVGVIFGRKAIQGSCGGAGGGSCVCTKKCDKRKRAEAEALENNSNI
jgi:hypothetical protein